ncbi:MAG TPA: trypsin-like peptidase domain-containing protein [Methylomirabilota bacterium]|nr:trypsin-like peptidase domain-containing protein [Methylomirabilota bacterium]
MKTLRWSIVLMWVLAGSESARLPAAEKPPSAAVELARQLNQAFVEVADSVSQSVVVIRVAHKRSRLEMEDEENPLWDMLPREFRRRLEEQRERERRENEPDRDRDRSDDENSSPHREPVFDGQGSGVVIREEGYILTNRHVVDGADKIKVRFADGAEFDAEIRGVDAQSDLAVLKIDPKDRKLAVAKLGDSDRTRVGEFAIAIGAPFELDYSVTFGHVSAKGRSRIIPDPAMDQDFIQTDANINPGNSGGPLVNIYGEVIGINTLIRGLRTGIGFAIPVNLAREVSEKLITDGKYVRAWLGVGIGALKDEPEYRERLSGVTEGVVVKQIQPDGPASKSDLKPSDVITAVDGKPVTTAQQLKNEIRSKSIGSTVVLDVHRHGKNIKVKVRPEAWPEETPTLTSRRPADAVDSARRFGLTVQGLTKDLAEQFGIEKVEGVVVTEVGRNSVAERKGLRPGDVITEVDGTPVTTPKDFLDAVKKADPKKGILIIFTSRGTSKTEILKDGGE